MFFSFYHYHKERYLYRQKKMVVTAKNSNTKIFLF